MEKKMPLTLGPKEVSSPHGTTQDFSDPSLAYIEQMLAEEDDENREGDDSLFRINPSALQAMEKSFLQVLSDAQHPPITHQQLQPHPLQRAQYSQIEHQQAQPYSPESGPGNYQYCSSSSSGSSGNDAISNSSGSDGAHSALSESDYILFQFQKGVDEANKYLPRNNVLSVSSDEYAHNELAPLEPKVSSQSHRVMVTEGFGRERKSEEEVDELSELFQKIYVGTEFKHKSPLENIRDIVSVNRATGMLTGSTVSIGKLVSEDIQIVDLYALLMNCAQNITSDNYTRAYEPLYLIRQHSSPFGDGNQRLAHCFANALESRLAGTGPQLYQVLNTSLFPSNIELTKAHHSFVSVCPFRMINFCFMIHHISILAEKAATLHIVDFGIRAGFLISRIIHHLSGRRTGIPLKVRITGIEEPHATDMVRKTGRRLAKFCERYNLQFEYNGIAQKWETISVEDIKTKRDEAIVVTSLLRFEKLLDEVVRMDSPRSAVLNLIRKINPNIFIHFAVNGTYDTPLFFPRFREAFFHYSTWFDMLDTIWSRDNCDRLMFERCLFGGEVLNIIACEGSERMMRAETYKKWQARTAAAGFRQMPLDRELVRSLKGIVKDGYHKDFMFEEDGDWVLQGWKGRTLCASSCWVPT